ncbi:Uncharacterised protein [Staphylococcus saprophyticus]|nr:Uncharacterised protein [Staphylococcus saprophyticus]
MTICVDNFLLKTSLCTDEVLTETMKSFAYL